MDRIDSETPEKLYKGTKIGLASTAAILAAALSGPAAPLAAGGAALAVELFSATFGPPLEKRRDQWIKTLYEKLEELETKIDDFKVENLTENEVFITTLINATQIAIRSHQKEKLDFLRNAVLNAALPNSLDDELQLLFLSFLDAFSATHITLLSFLDKPQTVVGEIKLSTIDGMIYLLNKEHLDKCIEERFPGFSAKPTLYDQVLKDLQERGFILMKDDFELLQEHVKKHKIETAVRKGDINGAFKYILDAEKEKEKKKSIKLVIDKLLQSPDREGKLLSDLGKAFVQFLSSPM